MKKLLLIISIAFFAFSCEKTPPPVGNTGVLANPGEVVTGGIQGFYLLGEGSAGGNNASLDYYDYSTGRYYRDVFTSRNPDEYRLGDTATDIEIYDSKLFIVLNNSNFVDVLNVETAKLIKKITIPNPRYIAFSGDFAYVTSYDGAQFGDQDNRKGYVAKIDLSSLAVVGSCMVGYQPEELVVVGQKLYVANSGGYQLAGYDNTVSVIDLGTFTKTEDITVAVNLWRLRYDGTDKLWVSSRGDYNTNPAAIYSIDTDDHTVTPATTGSDNFTIAGNTAYVIGSFYDPANNWALTASYSTLDLGTGTAGDNFITDGSQGDITTPYGLAVHPATGEIVVTDAGNFTRNGVVHCYTAEGTHHWSVSTGIGPATIAFTTVKLQ